jgi:hypothetical protein
VCARAHVGRYHDLKFNATSSLLYAAGDDHRVDVYAVAPLKHE